MGPLLALAMTAQTAIHALELEPQPAVDLMWEPSVHVTPVLTLTVAMVELMAT